MLLLEAGLYKFPVSIIYFLEMRPFMLPKGEIVERSWHLQGYNENNMKVKKLVLEVEKCETG
jgi:hypothetical protein